MYLSTASPKLLDFVDKFRSRAGEYPDAFSVNAYDCVWMLGLTIIYTGKYDGEAIKNALPHIAKIYFGASSWALLDENGDRVGGGNPRALGEIRKWDVERWVMQKVIGGIRSFARDLPIEVRGKALEEISASLDKVDDIGWAEPSIWKPMLRHNIIIYSSCRQDLRDS